MNLNEYSSHDALGLAALIAKGDVAAHEVTAAALAACQQVNPHINAVVEPWPDEVVMPRHAQAENAAFSGVPFLIKDLGATRAGRASELGSRIAAGLVAPADSTLMTRFRQSGLIPMGRTTTPEFAISTTTESIATGPTRNPWDVRRSVGGSSGGSAAAVAAGIVPFAHATDGGGSIRVPAAANGLFGMKPTRGRVSNGPFVDEIWSGLAVQFGLSRTVRDSAALLDAVHGGGTGEPYYIPSPTNTFLSALDADLQPLRIGLMLHPLNGTRTSPAVADQICQIAKLCESLGHDVVDVQLDPGVSWEAFVHANAQFFGVNTAAWINLVARLTGRKPDRDVLEPATAAVYALGQGITGLDLLGALDIRNTVTRALGAYFEHYDVLLTPTLPHLPPLIGEYNTGQEHLDGLAWVERVFGYSPFTAVANVAGIPAMSMPLSVDPSTGMPVGSHFVAGFGQEALLFGLAGQLEDALPWIGRQPSVWAGKGLERPSVNPAADLKHGPSTR